jgi:dTDP-glucose pyrophosphorylase
MKNWRDTLVTPAMPLRDALARIDSSGNRIALVVDEAGQLAGIMTDGDIRRALLRCQDLSIATEQVMNRNPSTAHISSSRVGLLDRMRRTGINHVPLVDDNGKVAGLATLDELVGVTERPNTVVLMAGGLGRRLHPLTEHHPKPMLVIGTKPILETILESFVEQGFRHFYFAVNYRADIIRKYFSDGDRWGVKIRYLEERQRLGTAGALSLLPEIPEEPVVVMNGDVLTRASIDGILQFHIHNGATATMAVRQHDSEIPYGVIELEGHHIRCIDEKPVQRFFVNAGIYVLSQAALGHVPKDTFFDMPSLFTRLIEHGEPTAAYTVSKYWLDIGRLEELERAQREWVED